MRFEFLPADAAGLSELARLAQSGRLDFEGLRLARRLDELPREPARQLEFEARAELARTCESRLSSARPHVAVIEAVRALAAPETGCVVTTVRPGPFGGPLLGLWKALTTIATARELARASGQPVVPLVWIEADDARLEESHPAWLPNHHGDLQRLALAELPSGARPAAEVALDEERQRLPALRAHLAQLYGDQEFVGQAIERCVPRSGETLAAACARGLLELFGAHGLVPIEPSWFRAPLSQGLARLASRDPRAELAAGAAALSAAGLELEPGASEEALVLRAEGGRLRPLRAAREGYRFDDEPGSRTAAELAAEIVQEPQAWSAGAAWLPLVQEALLPVLARVGDADELAREVRLLPLRAREGLGAPAFVLRGAVTLIDAETERALERLGTTPLELMRARGPQAEDPGDAELSAQAVTQLRASCAGVVAELLACRAPLARLDPAFSTQLRRVTERLEHALQALASKAEHARANRAGTHNRHARRAGSLLLPHGELQERGLGPFAFLARHGSEWLDELVSAYEPFTSEHLVVHLDLHTPA